MEGVLHTLALSILGVWVGVGIGAWVRVAFRYIVVLLSVLIVFALLILIIAIIIQITAALVVIRICQRLNLLLLVAHGGNFSACWGAQSRAWGSPLVSDLFDVICGLVVRRLRMPLQLWGILRLWWFLRLWLGMYTLIWGQNLAVLPTHQRALARRTPHLIVPWVSPLLVVFFVFKAAGVKRF